MARLALVTGGTRGIGAAVSKALKDAGYEVAANYGADDASAQKFKNETGIPVYKWNVSNDEDCVKGVAEIEQTFGSPIEVLVNNAGITRDAMMHKMTIDNWLAVIHTDLCSMFYMCRTVIPKMRTRNFGRIVNMSSINGKTGQVGQTNYAAAKAGIMGFTRSLALEGAFKNITVNAIAPGYIDTDMVRAVPPEILREIVTKIPVGRLGKPEEVARAVLFLVSDDAGFITGETLNVDGGQLMD